MTLAVEVGSILLEGPAMETSLHDVKSESYWGDWSLLEISDGSVLIRTLQESGWNFFFLAEELKASFLGTPTAEKIANAVRRILVEMKPQNFNGLEITGIVTKRFLGLPYATVSAHPRHLQQGCYLEGTPKRRAAQRNAATAAR